MKSGSSLLPGRAREKALMWLQQLLEIAFPQRCVICHRYDVSGLCSFCISSLPRIGKFLCHQCGKPLEKGNDCNCKGCNFYFDYAASFGIYEGNLKKVIFAFKFKGKRYLAAPLGKLMAKFLSELRWNGIDLIVPVPLHLKRLKLRGYNQALLLAEYIASTMNIPLVEVLVRKRDTLEQSSLGQAERKKNVEWAFEVREDHVPYLRRTRGILLVDDVLTTGATASECARILKQSGVSKVFVLTLARGL